MLARRAQYHQNVLVGHATPLDAGFRQMLQGTAQMLHQYGWSMADAGQRAQAMMYGLVQQQAAALSFVETFRVLAWVFVGLIPFMFLMRGVRR